MDAERLARLRALQLLCYRGMHMGRAKINQDRYDLLENLIDEGKSVVPPRHWPRDLRLWRLLDAVDAAWYRTGNQQGIDPAEGQRLMDHAEARYITVEDALTEYWENS